MNNYQNIIDTIYNDVMELENRGEVATYIPELGKINPDKFGVCLTTLDNTTYIAGNANERFSIQSISKVLSLTLAYTFEGEALWERVDVEPSGTPFNSLIQLEADNGIPRNPLINAGALVICDVLVSHLKNPKKEFLAFIRRLTNNDTINYSETIAASEKVTGFRNAALINLIKTYNNIHNPIEEVLDFYFNMCAIEMSCVQLSKAFLYLAADGINPLTNETIVSESKSKRINAIMQLCGFYDEAGEFAFRVGLPGKSGVGGGIVAVLPDEYTITIWSPKLNTQGNSYLGMRFLESFTTATASSIF